MNIHLNVNSGLQEIIAVPGESLLSVLRRLGYFGTKRGCEDGSCGACTILMDGKPTNSCLILAAQAEGHSITTIESIGQVAEQGWRQTGGLHPIQQAFLENAALQCGICTPGFIMSAKALLDHKSEPNEAEIRHWCAGNLCRCTGYDKIVSAILDAGQRMTIKG